MSSIEHTALIERFAAACRSDERIVAAFVGGSRGAGTADEYADSDLYLVLRDQSYDEWFAERRAFVGRLGEPLVLEDFNSFGFDMLLFLFADGVEGELIIARLSSFEHIPSGPFQALLDRDGVLPPAGAFPPLKQPSPDEQRVRVRWLVSWFWRDLSQLSRCLARGQVWSAYFHGEMVRETCLGLLRARHGDSPSLGNYHKVELVADPDELAVLRHTFGRPERAAIIDEVAGLLEVYRQIAPPLAAAHGIPYPAQLERTVLRRLQQECGTVL